MIDVPLLVGSTDFDGSSLRGGNPEDVVARASDDLLTAYESDKLSGEDLGYQMYTDQHVSAPARWIARQASTGAPSYLYLFSYVSSQNRVTARGAAHGDDMFYLFDAWNLVNPALQLTDEDREVANLLRSCWVSFAKTGTPKCQGAPDWPRYTSEGDALMDLGARPQVRRSFRKRQLDAQEEARRGGIEGVQRSIEEFIRGLEQNLL